MSQDAHPGSARPNTDEGRDLADVRTDYEAEALHRNQLDPDPLRQFGAWMDEALASDVVEPTAMSLATLRDDGMPQARIVLLKGFDARGFRFFTNQSSAKGRQLAAHPKAQICFFWDRLHRQVRIDGQVRPVPDDEASEYFARRPRGSQLSAQASPQSRVVADRAELERAHRQAEERYAGVEVPRPDAWGGYRLEPDTYEFWQGRPSRLHDRFRYRRAEDGGRWTLERMAP